MQWGEPSVSQESAVQACVQSPAAPLCLMGNQLLSQAPSHRPPPPAQHQLLFSHPFLRGWRERLVAYIPKCNFWSVGIDCTLLWFADHFICSILYKIALGLQCMADSYFFSEFLKKKNQIFLQKMVPHIIVIATTHWKIISLKCGGFSSRYLKLNFRDSHLVWIPEMK